MKIKTPGWLPGALSLRSCRVVRCFLEVIARRAFEEGAQFPRTRRMAQLAQCFRFDLADALAGDSERLADFFERVLAAIIQALSLIHI